VRDEFDLSRLDNTIAPASPMHWTVLNENGGKQAWLQARSRFRVLLSFISCRLLNAS
jgi:hypothetical protein